MFEDQVVKYEKNFYRIFSFTAIFFAFFSLVVPF